MWSETIADLRHAARTARRRPLHTAACTTTLALVFAANTTLFAALDATLVRPIALRYADRLVRLVQLPAGVSDVARGIDLEEGVLAHIQHNRTLDAVAAYQVTDRVLEAAGEPRVVRLAEADAGWLALSPEPPVIGRAYTAAEDAARERLVVLGWDLWRQSFGGSSEVLGTKVSIDGEPFSVVGVMPKSFPPHFATADLWSPLGVGFGFADGARGRQNLVTLAVLAEGASVEQAGAEAAARMESYAAAHPELAGEAATATSVRRWLYGSYRAPFAVLAGAMLLLLVLACTNLAASSLLQLRARESEMWLRRVLGGSRLRLARLVLADVMLLGLCGAVAGLALAAAALPVLLRIDPAAARALGPVTVGWRVAAAALASPLVFAVVAAVIPALVATREDTQLAREAGGRSHGGRGRDGWRGALVVVQAAVCLALLVGCALSLRALARSSAVAPGFDTRGVTTAQLRLSPLRHETHESRIAVVESLLARIRALPGVTEAATGLGDFRPGNSWVTTVTVESAGPGSEGPRNVQLRRVTPDYFPLLRIPLVAGRGFDSRDHADAPLVAVVNRAFAASLLGGRDPIGRRFERSGRHWTIVGVSADVRDVDLVQPPEPTVYLPWHQSSSHRSPVGLLVRSAVPPETLGPALARAVREVDAGLPLNDVQPLGSYVDHSLAPQRFRVTLLAWLAAVGLAIGVTGVAALTAQTVAERTGELAVRLALGGDGKRLWAAAVGRQLRRVALGASLGAALAFAYGQVAAALLPELGGFDLVATALASGVLVAAAAVAAAIPAARVLRLDPMRALRL
jgi:putative ABC transport system permease protein